jgi:hypothetical protein
VPGRFAVLVAAVLALVVTSLGGCDATGSPPDALRGARLESSYRNLVADQGNSVGLPDGRMLWLFADTAQTHGEPWFFVTSSAAVAERDSLSVRFLKDEHGRPLEFLPRTSAERRRTTDRGYVAVWPTGATTLPDGRILIAYTKYFVSPGPPTFTFLAAGLYAYRHPGPGGDAGTVPARRVADDIWTPDDGPVASPVRAGRYVYFSQCERRPQRCYSLRAPVDRVAERAAYRWWTGTGWRDESERRPMRFGSDRPGRNPPTRYLPDHRLYVVVDTPAGIPATTGLIWVAPRPWGPWSSAAEFHLPRCARDQGCYTLNPHPEADAPDGMLRVSYAAAHTGPHVHVVDVPIKLGPRGAWVRVQSTAAEGRESVPTAARARHYRPGSLLLRAQRADTQARARSRWAASKTAISAGTTVLSTSATISAHLASVTRAMRSRSATASIVLRSSHAAAGST